MEPKPKSYCEYVKQFPAKHVHRIHHDSLHGFAVTNDDALFERLILEINQAGLSWATILNKLDNFRKAYDGFSISRVASYDEKDRKRLLMDAGIIRNRLKVDAAIHNAIVILELQKKFGSFRKWLNHHHPMSREEWTRLFRKTFKFTGSEIVNEFMMSTGYLPGAHTPDCPLYKDVLASGPMWAKKDLH